MKRSRTPNGKFATEEHHDLKPSLAAKLDRVAERILDAALADKEMPLADQIDVLKTVGAYHLGLSRLSGKLPPPDEGGPSFREWGERLKQERADA